MPIWTGSPRCRHRYDAAAGISKALGVLVPRGRDGRAHPIQPPHTHATPIDPAADASASLVAHALGLIGISDPLRPGSPAAVARLQQMGLRVLVLSGDNPATVRAIARQAGIADEHDMRGQLLPADKVMAVEAERVAGRCIGMVGDGINDAPALAAASVSFAMGAGTDVAMKTADITLMRNDLGSIADAISLSRATLGKIRQNLFFAFIYNIIGIPAAAMGWLDPMLAGAAMAASSVSVVSNSLLLKRWHAHAHGESLK